jgi:hypothetical protein
MARARRRSIKGVKLSPGGLLPGEERVTDWPGGELRVVFRQPEIIEGVPLAELPIEEIEWQRDTYVPFGGGFALPQPLKTELVQEAPGLEFEIAVRDDQPRCVAIRSLKEGPPLTTTLLKSSALPAIGRVVRETVTDAAVRLVRTVDGEVIGVQAHSTPDLHTSFEDRSSDVADAVDEIQSAERRWRITDQLLSEVADEYRDAHARGVPTGRAIATRWMTTEQNARRWISRAREAGYLSKPTPPKENTDA